LKKKISPKLRFNKIRYYSHLILIGLHSALIVREEKEFLEKERNRKFSPNEEK